VGFVDGLRLLSRVASHIAPRCGHGRDRVRLDPDRLYPYDLGMGGGSIAAFAGSITVEAPEADPYPIYVRLRRDAPVCFIPAVRLWFVTRYDDVEFVGTHREQFTAQLDDSPVDRTFGSPAMCRSNNRLRG
jgi:hypothetical protein